MTCRACACVVVAMICLLGRPAAAQEYVSDPQQDHAAPAHIAFVDGTVLLERDGQLDRDPRSMPLLTGDRIRTEGGRAEVLFADGSALHLDAGTVVDFQSDEVVRVLSGRIRLSIVGPGRDVFYRIDGPSAWIEVHEVGEYRVTVAGSGDVELAVLRGSAELVNELGRSLVRAGEQTFARAGGPPSQPYVFNSAAWDPFDRWSEERRTARLGRSAQYLPADVRPYAGTFDTYGAWRHEPAYGYVWYPRVAAGWRPYYHGRWVTLRPYGWTWVAADPWGWPTHHYGRWGFSAGAWFWIPGRHWGPAWVSWAYTPHYVSWCPLGWNNRPVIQIVNVNIGVGRRYSPWDAWTVVPRRHFSGTFVNVRAVGSVRIDQRIQNTFVVRDRAPETRFAVPRDAAPIRSAGRIAVPRTAGYAASTSGRTSDTGRRLTSPGGSGTTADRRFPAPARTSEAAASPRAGDRSVPAAGARATARERDPAVATAPASRVRSAGESPVGGRAVTRDADGGSAAGPASRARSTAPSPSAQPPATGGRPTGQPAGRRTAQPAPARAPEAAPSPDARRAVPREQSSAAEPASGRDASANAMSPGRARPAAPSGGTVPRRQSSVRPASPAAPASAPAVAAPADRPAPVRSRTSVSGPGAAASVPPAPRAGSPSAPVSRSRPEPAPASGRAASRDAAPPSSAPAPRAVPERRAPAAAEPASSSAPRSSARPASRTEPSAGAGARQRSSDAASSGQRGRRRE